MKNLNNYLKYYFLEKYLFQKVHKHFRLKGYIPAEDFFAIVIWKRNASKTKILRGIKNTNKTIRVITSGISSAPTPLQKLQLLKSIPGIGISIASAILTVCYPERFTIADYRAKNSLKNFFDQKDRDTDYSTPETYMKYVDVCIKLAKNHHIPLRDFDRILWGMDFYKGKGGLKELAKDL